MRIARFYLHIFIVHHIIGHASAFSLSTSMLYIKLVQEHRQDSKIKLVNRSNTSVQGEQKKTKITEGSGIR